MIYMAIEYVYDGGDAMGFHKGAVIQAPCERQAEDLVESLMSEGDPPFWPEYADNIQFDPGSVELAPDVGSAGFYYTSISDMEIEQELYDEAISEGMSEEEAADVAFTEARTVVGVEPLSWSFHKTKKAAMDALKKAGLVPPHRVQYVEWPW